MTRWYTVFTSLKHQLQLTPILTRKKREGNSFLNFSACLFLTETDFLETFIVCFNWIVHTLTYKSHKNPKIYDFCSRIWINSSNKSITRFKVRNFHSCVLHSHVVSEIILFLRQYGLFLFSSFSICLGSTCDHRGKALNCLVTRCSSNLTQLPMYIEVPF